MKDPSNTYQALIEEISLLKQRIKELEQSESGCKTSEKTLQKTERLLNIIIDTIPAMIWQKDLEGRYLLVNNAYCRTVGLPKEAILGRTDYDLYPKEIADKYVSHDMKVLTSGKSDLGIEEYHKKPSGDYGWSLTDKLACIDDQGNIIGTIGFALDITERKQAEEKILTLLTSVQEEKNRTSSLIDSITDEVWFTDTQKRFTIANPSALKQFCLAPGQTIEVEKLAKSLEVLRPDGSPRPVEEAPPLRALSGEVVMNQEEIVRIPASGEFRHRQVSSAPVRDSSGHIIGSVSVVRDITEFKRAEEALHERELFLNAVGTMAKVGGWKLDVATGKVYWTTETYRIHDIPEDTDYDLSGAVTFFDMPGRTILEAAIQRCIETGEFYDLELAFTSAKGRHLWTHTIGHAVQQNGKTIELIGTFQDITDRKHMEDELKSNYALLQIAGDTARFGGWSVDLSNNICTWSDVVADIHEVPRDYVPSVEEGINFYTPEWQEKITQVFSACAKEGIPYDEDMEIITQKGKRVWVRTTGRAVRNKDGKTIKVQGSFQDITQSKRVEEELRKSENLFKKVFEILPIGLWIADKNGKLMQGNPAGVKIWGMEPKVGQSEYGVFKARRLPSREEIAPEDWALAHTVNKGVTIVNELLEIDAFDGKKKIILNYTAPILDSNGEVEGAIVVNQDITDHKRAEEKLQESYKALSLFIKNSPIYAYLKEVTPAESRVLWASENYLDMIGIPGSQMTGKKMEELFPPEFAKKITQDDWDVVSKGEVLNLDEDLNNRNYTTIKFPISLSEKNLLAGYTIDITDRKHMEAELREAEEKYRGIFEGAQEGIFRSTPEGSIVMANPAMARIAGYESPQEMITAINDAAHQFYVKPEERAEVLNRIEENGFVKGVDAQFYRKDGTVIWCNMSARAIRDGVGKTIYYEGIIEDITERKQSTERLRKALRGTVEAIAVTVEARDPYTAGHQRRVSDLARAIATRMNLPYDQIDGLRMAGLIHDIGKVSIPAEILSTPRKLTHIEFTLVKTHPQSGYDILKDIEFPWPIARMVLEHHERMDGSGYPNGPTGDNLLLESRILAVADVVEAMSTHRPYRPALGIDAALEEIASNKGILYDPEVVDACLHIFNVGGYKIKD